MFAFFECVASPKQKLCYLTHSLQIVLAVGVKIVVVYIDRRIGPPFGRPVAGYAALG